jgi:hypothetical protein
MLSPICYLAVCYTLQQCIELSHEFAVHQPGTSLDIFYWRQGAERRVPSSAHSLQDIVDSYPELSHWDKLAPAASMHWLPYYYYYNSEHDSERCSYYVKFTADTRFLVADPASSLLPLLEGHAHSQQEAVLSLEQECYLGHAMDSLNAVTDLHAVMQMLTYYQLESQAQPVPIYPETHLDDWLRRHPELLRTSSVDLTMCVDATSAEENGDLFYKVLVKEPLEALQEENARLLVGNPAPGPVGLF